MEGVIQRQALGEGAGIGERLFQQAKLFRVAGQGHATRAVDAGEMDIGVVVAGEPFADLRLAEGHGGHLALSASLALVVAAEVDDPDRILQAQGAAGPGGRHLADAVAGHGTGLDAVVTQQLRDTDLHGEQRRLGDLGQHQAALSILQGAVPALELGAQREVAMALEEGIDLIHGRGEHPRALQQVGAHALPLAAVAGVDEAGHAG